ncbi:hypothetical protein M2390_001878 [Mycetocola sp. BIGb0189]|uniref:hypothetical protein n=1 Tax=Mycetocola sp. BIGb0189 TaxID=2940604 RepID=UPI0021674F4A|nr:hypothetical protein [Mycetocola sp. BIGb0189]MCS4276684.1 hypothetical protein [Mycetocola sp. BIGb0189]
MRVPEVNKSSADPVKVKTDLWRELDAVQELAGGEWTNQDSLIANRCTGGGAFFYTGTRVMKERLPDPAAFADAVAKLWAERGFEVTRTHYFEDDVDVFADLADGGTLELKNDNDEETFFVSGTTGCYPGDSQKIGEQDMKELEEKESSSSPSPSE